MSSKDVVLAIDPGYDRCGVALIAIATATVIYSTCLVTDKKDDHKIRLAFIFKGLEKIVKEHQPVAIALETLFFSVNKKTALAVAEARGVAVTVAGLHDLFLLELSPQAVKLAVTGSGNADKKSVQKMVQLLLKTNLSTKMDDEIDAIALGIAAVSNIKIKELLGIAK